MKEMESLKIEEVEMVGNHELKTIGNDKVEVAREYLIFDELIESYQEGDQEAMAEIIRKVEPMIRKRCSHYFGYIDQDLMQQGRMRCVMLIQKYDSNLTGVKFLGYMNRMLECYFWDLKKAQLRKERYQYQLIDDSCLSLNNMPYNEKGYIEIELEDLIEGLSEKERYIIRENILFGKKLIDTARELGISYEYSKDIKKSALIKLRKLVVR